MTIKTEYKSSGTDWLGDVPATWSISKIDELFQKKKEYSLNEEELLSVYRDHGVIPKSSRDDNHNKESEDLSNYILIKPDDLVINKMKAWQGSLAISQYRGIVSPAYFTYGITRAGKQKLHLPYLHHLLRSRKYIETYRRISKGIRPAQWDLDPYQFKILPVLVPPLDTQKRIADFLNTKTKIVDELIGKKQQLIELIKEKHIAYINNLLIKAVGEATKIKACATINPSRGKLVSIKFDDLVSFIPMEAISETGELSPQERFYSDVQSGFTYFENGDVVLAKITPCYENGKAGVIENLKYGFGFGTTEFLVMRPSKKMIAQYLYLLVYSDKFRKNGEVEMRGTAGQKRVSNNFVRNYEFILPALHEQEKAVSLFRERSQTTRLVIKNIESQIEKLKEYRSSLIYSAVTGKLTV